MEVLFCTSSGLSILLLTGHNSVVEHYNSAILYFGDLCDLTNAQKYCDQVFWWHVYIYVSID